MRNGTGRIIFWGVTGVIGAAWAARKLGINVPGLNG